MKIGRNCRALVTGGGSGLGRALSVALARRGACIWIADLDLAAAKQTAAECLENGANEARAFLVDVSRVEDLSKLAIQANLEWQGIDLIVNNAGVAVAGRFEEQTLEDWQWIMDVNLWGVIYGCQAFLPLLKKSDNAGILNIASSAGLLNPPKLSSYNVTKAAVVALSESLRSELSQDKITVSVACPTFFKTGILEHARVKDQTTKQEAEKYFQRSFSTADSVASACIRALESKRLYVLPSWDAKLLWFLKRFAPATFCRITAAFLPRR